MCNRKQKWNIHVFLIWWLHCEILWLSQVFNNVPVLTILVGCHKLFYILKAYLSDICYKIILSVKGFLQNDWAYFKSYPVQNFSLFRGEGVGMYLSSYFTFSYHIYSHTLRWINLWLLIFNTDFFSQYVVKLYVMTHTYSKIKSLSTTISKSLVLFLKNFLPGIFLGDNN